MFKRGDGTGREYEKSGLGIRSVGSATLLHQFGDERLAPVIRQPTEDPAPNAATHPEIRRVGLKDLDDLGEALPERRSVSEVIDGPSTGRRPESVQPAHLGAGVRPTVEQQAHGPRHAVTGSHDQRSNPTLAGPVDVCPDLDEGGDGRSVAHVDGVEQRCPAVHLVTEFDVRAGCHQHPEDARIRMPGSEVQGAPAGLGHGVRVGARVLQQRFHRREIPGGGRRPERRVIHPVGAGEEGGRQRGGEDQSAPRKDRASGFGMGEEGHARGNPVTCICLPER